MNGYQPFRFDHDLSGVSLHPKTAKIRADVGEKDGKSATLGAVKSESGASDASTDSVSDTKLQLRAEFEEELRKELLQDRDELLKKEFEAGRTQGQQSGHEEGLQQGLQDGLREGHEEGRREATKEFRDEAEREGLRLLSKLEERSAALFLRSDEWIASRDNEIAEMVSMLMKRLVPVYTRDHGAQEIASFIQQVMNLVISKPDIEIRLPTSSAHLTSTIREMMIRAGAQVGIQSDGAPAEGFRIKTDDSLSEADCVVKWDGGIIEKRDEIFWQEVDNLIKSMEKN